MSLTHLVLAGWSIALLTAEVPRPPTVRRMVAVPGPGRVALTLDTHVYEHARRDLGDLRIVDDLGHDAPYLLQWAEEGAPPSPRAPVTIDRGFVRGRSATATLDFGAPTLKSDVGLSLSGDNFRRRVKVEGRHRRDEGWTTLTDGAYVFAIPGTTPARYETVSLPENDFELLRVTVFRGADDPPVIEIRQASIIPASQRRLREAALETAGTSLVAEHGKARDTLVTIELRGRFQPVRAVTLDVADERFFREVTVEARREVHPADARAAPSYWTPIGSGAIYRYRDGEQVHERLRVEACGREQAVRVRLRNGDDRPLHVRSTTVLGAVGRLAFEARPERRYTLEYGTADRPAPSYDLARTVGDATLWMAGASEGALLHPDQLRHLERRAWTERHPALLWGGLVVAVAALGTLTWRALRAAG